MKLNLKKITSLVLITIILLSNIIPSVALAIEGTPELKVEVSKINLQRGEEFTASVNFKDNGSKDCEGFNFMLKYDSDVLEVISADTANTGMLVTPNTGVIGEVNYFAMGSQALSYEGSLITVKFKVKDNAVGGTTSLRIESDEKYPISNSSAEIPTTVTNQSVKVEIPVQSIELSEKSLSIKESETHKLEAIYTPTDTTQKNVKWSSSDESIAKISQDGTITALTRGKTTITATTENGTTASCDVTVTREIGSVILDKSSISLDKGESTKITATIPTDTDGDKTISWTTSDSSVATVSNDGTVTAVDRGEAIITATTANGKKAICAVNVSVKLKSIAFEGNITEKTFNLGVDQSNEMQLNVIYDPEDADVDKSTLEWSSSNTSVVTVNDGLVTAKGKGDATVTAKIDGKMITCNVHVRIPILSIEIKDKVNLTYGEEEKLAVTYTTYNNMETTDDKTIKWETSDKNIVQVSTDGTITTKGTGKATITATSVADQKLVATCEVEIAPVPLKSIIIEQQSIVIEKGDTKTLTVKFNPENTSDSKKISWESSNPDAVTIDSTGVITAMKNGKATITAKTPNGQEATTEVTVVTLLKDIKLSETDITINKDVPLTLKVTLDPTDATLDDDTVKWSSSNTEVATVNENGEVTTHKAGTAFIYVTVGGITKECKITVNVPLTGLEIDDKITLLKGQEKLLDVIKQPEGTNFNGKITFDSTDPKKATVDKEGRIEALSATEEDTPVIITVNAVENNVIIASATCEVTVIEIPLDSITINQADFSLGLGRSQKLKVLYNPETTTDDKTVMWSSSNSDVVSVDSNGTVTAKSVGEAVITAIVNGKYAEVLITTYEIPITAIKVYTNISNNKIAVGKAITLTVKVIPEDATRQGNYKFTSSDERILTVDEKGNVIAHAVGKTLITVETENGIKEQVEIEVVKDKAAAAAEYKRLSPQTGDINIEIYATIMLVSALGIVIMIITNKRGK
ncbi:MAG: hypothetical protein HFJ44_05680 [Clostridia bacterium]|jgi:uncharacterized protein YjdB|nr:hypothetical protein [Clostridia bacterium]